MDGRNAAHIAYKAALTTAHSERVPSLSRKRYVPVVYAYIQFNILSALAKLVVKIQSNEVAIETDKYPYFRSPQKTCRISYHFFYFFIVIRHLKSQHDLTASIMRLYYFVIQDKILRNIILTFYYMNYYLSRTNIPHFEYI